jgi:hypothetical membrane protein
MSSFWTVWVLRFVPSFFVIAVCIGIFSYPGGNIHNPDQIGYSFTHNFLSDLGGYRSHSGEVNFISSFFFNAGMFFFAAVGVGFLYVPALFKEDRVNYRLALLGSVLFLFGTTFFSGVGLTPYDLYLDLHVFFAVNAFRFLVPASMLYLILLLRSGVDNRFALVTGAYLVCVVAYVIYQMMGGNPFDSAEEMVRQATIQKLIVMASVVSIFSLSFAFEHQARLQGAQSRQ